MSLATPNRPHPLLNVTTMSCYAVATCAFATSLVGLGVAHWPTLGIASVGVGYLVLGILSYCVSPGESLISEPHGDSPHDIAVAFPDSSTLMTDERPRALHSEPLATVGK